MARAKRRTPAKSAARSTRRSKGAASSQDAIALLKADHREVEGYFEQFSKTRSEQKKRDLAQRICKALRVHTQVEAEIFYPAFLEATAQVDIHHEAEVEHGGAKQLIAEIERSGPEDEYYEARVSVLSEMIKHHVNEEERRDGMFAKARRADMDLRGLGEQLKARKDQLMASGDAPPRTRRGLAGSFLSH